MDRFHGNDPTRVFLFWSEAGKFKICILLSETEYHIINNLLTELSQAILGNIGPQSWQYGPRFAWSVLPQPRANIPQYGPHTRLVSG